jgi:hypothetical protein
MAAQPDIPCADLEGAALICYGNAKACTEPAGCSTLSKVPEPTACDADAKCPEGTECYKFQDADHPVCWTGDPCVRCASGECNVAESYPPQIFCTEPNPGAEGDAGPDGGLVVPQKDAGPAGGDAGTAARDGGTADAGDGSADSGCSCSAVGARPRAPASMIFFLALVWSARRWRRG